MCWICSMRQYFEKWLKFHDWNKENATQFESSASQRVATLQKGKMYIDNILRKTENVSKFIINLIFCFSIGNATLMACNAASIPLFVSKKNCNTVKIMRDETRHYGGHIRFQRVCILYIYIYIRAISIKVKGIFLIKLTWLNVIRRPITF
jgi:hypothetical protein